MFSDIFDLLKDHNRLFLNCILYSTTLTISALVVSRYFKSRAWSKLTSSPFYKTMDGKVVIVTGANCGIGFETVRELVKLDATVILGCRDVNKGKEAVDKLKQELKRGDEKMIVLELDLASFSSIKKFANNVLNQFPEVHCLVNNAGVSVPITKNQKTVEGYEINFGVNHVGHFLLTNLLIDRIEKSSTSTDHSKVVIVASSLLDRGTIDFDNLNGEKGFVQKGHSNPAYCNSKLMNYYFAAELYLKYVDKDVDVCAVCPGWCYTNLFRYADIKWYQKVFIFPIAMMYMRSANQGAQSVVHCVIQKDQNKHFPPIFRDFAPYTTKHNYDDKTSKKLWDVTAKLTST